MLCVAALFVHQMQVIKTSIVEQGQENKISLRKEINEREREKERGRECKQC